MSTGIVASAGALFFTALSRSAATSLLRIRQFVVAIKHRQELQGLLEGDDHRLADIGIDRDYLRAALSEPLWRDPTAALAGRMKAQGGHGDFAIPTCPAVPPSMDLGRYLAALDRKSLPAQLRRRADRPNAVTEKRTAFRRIPDERRAGGPQTKVG